MSISRPALSTLRPRTGRLGAFGGVQLLLVLWIAASEFIQLLAGLTILPEIEQPSAAVTAHPLVRTLLAVAYVVLAFFLVRRFPLWTRPRRHAAYYLGALAGLHLATWGCSLALPALGLGAGPGWTFYLQRTLEFVLFSMLAHGLLYAERYHQQEREELRLRAEMAESTAERTRAQVRALRMEWSPRFLTETLDSIAELLSRDVARAKRMLVALSSVLRRSLSHLRTDVVRLENEVQFVREVLKVESLRRPALTVEWVVDEGAWELPVPHLSLLTMVSHALQGSGPDDAVHLRIGGAARADGVHLSVEASGGAADRSDALEARIRRLYGTGHGFRRTVDSGGAVRMEMHCPAEPRERTPGDDPPPLPAMAAEAAPPVDAAEPGRPFLGGRLEFATYATFLICNVLLAFYAAWGHVAERRAALRGPAWLYVAGSGFYVALWWGSLVTLAWFLSRRFPLRRGKWMPRALLHAAALLAVAVLNAVAYFPFQWYVVRGGAILIGLRSYWEWGDVAVYVPLAGIAHGFSYAREYQARRTSELRLRSMLSESEARRSEAELQVLKAELNPHFLFNALNTVSSLMHTRVDEARRVAGLISELLRRVLESGDVQEATVEEEVDFIRLYMEIEEARFGDALRMEYRLDADTLQARVPHLLIQPLVENAVKHGLRPRGGTGRVTLSARRDGGWLELAVEDDGVGLSHLPREEGTGTGLTNVRLRLRQIYGERHRFELAPVSGGGAVARVRIPFAKRVPAGTAAALTPEAQPA